ncbi:TonB-dependent receptor, partial [Pseudomonas aeruginosa]
MNRRPAYRSIPSSRSAPFRRRLLPLSICLACAGGAQLAGADDTPAGTEEARQAQPATTLQTVTVTSRRRVENSQDVPTAMSVLGGETLESQRIYRV